MPNLYINSSLDKVLAIGILVLFLSACFVFFNYLYLNQIQNSVKQIEFSKKKNAKIGTILTQQKQLQKEINQRRISIKSNRIFLINHNPANAASELQNYLKKLVATHSNAKILSIKPYPVLEHDGFYETSLELRLKGVEHKEIQKILYMIESRSPVVLVKEIDIKRAQIRFKTVLKQDKKKNVLGVNMVVSAFFRGGV